MRQSIRFPLSEEVLRVGLHWSALPHLENHYNTGHLRLSFSPLKACSYQHG